MVRLFFFFLLLTLVLSCDSRSSPDYFLNEYQVRISRVTGQPVPETESPMPQLPSLKNRQYSLPDIRIGALDALGLLKCPELSQSIAWRNSSLGKQMQPSQLLHYEKKLINQLSGCLGVLAQAEENGDLRKELRGVLESKRQSLPAVKWNAVFAGAELSSQLRGNGRLLTIDGDNGFQGTINALNYLASYLPDASLNPPYTRETLEKHLQQLLSSRYSGQLIASVVELTTTLNHISSMLEATEAVCPNGRSTVTAQRLNNVFRLFYADVLQSYLVKLVREGEQWREAMKRVMAVLPVAPSHAMTHFIEVTVLESALDSIWILLQQSVARHTAGWQKVFSECGIIPK